MIRIFSILWGLIFFVSCKTSIQIQDHRDHIYHLNAANQKWVVLSVWADWCAPCIEEIPELNHFHERYHHRIFVFGANYDGIQGEALANMVKKLKIQFPILTNNYEVTFGLMHPKILPVIFILDPQGKLIRTLHGTQTQKSLKKHLQTLGVRFETK